MLLSLNVRAKKNKDPEDNKRNTQLQLISSVGLFGYSPKNGEVNQKNPTVKMKMSWRPNSAQYLSFTAG